MAPIIRMGNNLRTDKTFKYRRVESRGEGKITRDCGRFWKSWRCVEYILPIVGLVVAFVIMLLIFSRTWSHAKEKFTRQPMTLPTDSLVGPRVEIQQHPLQIANGGDQRIWIEWAGSPEPFYPEEYKGEPHIVKAKGGGRIRIDPGQYVFFPIKKIRLNNKFRISPLMGCAGDREGCQVGTDSVTPYFEFSFSPPWDSVLVSAETGTTLPFNFSYFSGEENAVTTMICSLPPEECPDAFQALNVDEKFVGCASAKNRDDVYQTLLAQNCLVTQSPSHHLVGSRIFDGENSQVIYIPSVKENRFKLTFYVKGFEWIN